MAYWHSLINGILSTGPSVAFSPSSVSGLALWLDASDLSTLTQDSAGTVPVTSTSDPVGRWADKSGNAYHGLQDIVGSRSSYQAAAKNGHGVLRMDGLDDYFELAGLDAGSNCTFFFVVKPTTSTSGLFDSAPWTANVLRASGVVWDWFANQPIVPLDLTASTWAMVELAHSLDPSRAITYHRNAALIGTYTNASTTPAAWASIPTIGVVNTGEEAFGGDIAEVIIYDTTLSSTSEAAIRDYLLAKWGILGA